MKMKKWIFIILVILIILVVPVKRNVNDGGTVVYSAAVYKVIKWNRIRNYEENKTGTEVHFFPKNLHSLEYYDPPRPEAIAIYNGDKFVVANIGTYQWSKKVDGETIYVNACSFGPLEMEYSERLKIKEGTNVKTAMLNVSEIIAYKFYSDKEEIITYSLRYNQETQEINVSELDKGNYVVELLVEDGNNKVRYSFMLEIVDELEMM